MSKSDAHKPQVLAWHEAAEHLLDQARSRLTSSPVVVIGVTGPVGAGKTTLASRLSSCIVSTDHYLPDYELIPEHERDDPRHADSARLATDLATLRKGLTARIPIWSFHSHKREGERELHPEAIVVCEGIHALHGQVVAHMDFTVYVDAPKGVRWSRWEYLEATGQRGWGVEKAKRYFDSVADPTFMSRHEQYRSRADFIVVNDKQS